MILSAGGRKRAHVVIHGAVQGVGFRPFVHRLASAFGLAGCVSNTGQGVVIDVEGDPEALEAFLVALDRDRPPRAVVVSRECVMLDPAGARGFEIRDSTADREPSAFVLPDIATCHDCLAELFDPGNRRYRIHSSTARTAARASASSRPAVRPRATSMSGFAMCPLCRREYRRPARSTVSRAAECVPGVWTFPVVVGCRGGAHGARGRRAAAGREGHRAMERLSPSRALAGSC